MTVLDLYPPIAAAMIVFTLWAIVLYRLHKRDEPKGHHNESIAQAMWILVAPASVGAFWYFQGSTAAVTTPVQIFFSSLTGIGMGALGIFAFKQAFFTRHEQRRYKVISLIQCGFFFALCFVMPFWM